jgi:hypothetical protein
LVDSAEVSTAGHPQAAAVHVGEEPLVRVHAHRVRELGAVDAVLELGADEGAPGVRGVDV